MKLSDSKTLYRLINLTSLLFIIISLILAFSLYNKGKEFFAKNKTMKSTIDKIAVTLDHNSGTSYARNLLNAGAQDPQTLTNNLKSIETQAKNIIAQRDNMGRTLTAVSENLELPIDFNAKLFQSLKTYSKANNELALQAQKINARNDSMIGYFIKMGNDIKAPIKTAATFKAANKNLEGYTQPLNKLAQDVKSLASEQDKSKAQLMDHKAKIKELEQSFASSGSSDKELQTLISEYEKQLEELQNENQGLYDSIDKGEPVGKGMLSLSENQKQLQIQQKKKIISKLYLKLTGKVLKYNKKWGFAVINLGQFNNVNYTFNGKEETASVSLPVNKEMYVARKNKFIAKVNIAKVFDKYAIVNLESPSTGIIEPDDTVFFPNQ